MILSLNKKFSSFWFIFILSSLAVLIYIFFVSEILHFKAEISQLASSQNVIFPLKEKEAIKVFLVGDVMLDRGVELMVQQYGARDWTFPFAKISDFLRKADILFCNLEGPISNKGQNVGSIYSFRNNPKALEGLRYAGFNIISVANNHIFDYGKEAMEDTFKRLEGAGIDYIGGGFSEKEAYSQKIKELKGTKIAFLAFTNLGSEKWKAKATRSGIAWLEKERLEKEVKEAKKKADLVIVSFHFGKEYSLEPTEDQVAFSKMAIEAGSNLVVGHHPHVIQRFEKYKEGYIAYSLGNFVFDQGFSEETMKGLLLKVIIGDGKIKEITPIEVKLNRFFQPEIK